MPRGPKGDKRQRLHFALSRTPGAPAKKRPQRGARAETVIIQNTRR